jgi:hypothetical protein
MRYRELTILAGVVAALALAQTPASALDLLGGRIHVDLGSKNGVNANVGVRLSDQTNATASANIGGAQTANVTANVNTGRTVARSLSAKAVVDLSDDSLHATVDLNGDGTIDGDDTAAMLKLDINGDGVLSLLDDANHDGILSAADIAVDLPDVGELIGSILTVDTPDATDPTPPAARPPFDSSPNDIANALHGIDDDDVAALKVKCATVLANPGFYNATTLSICRALRS